MKKFISVALASILSLCALAGCTHQLPDASEEEETSEATSTSKGKTTLTVGVFDGGLGSDWVYAIKKRFEKKYANVSFEEGKMGVTIKVVSSRNYSQSGMELGIDSISEDIIFAEGANALYFAEKGCFLDITDVATTSLQYDFVTKQTDASIEDKTIEDKLNEQQKTYFSAVNNKYYALPTTEKLTGLAYDMEFFEENNLYFAKNGGFVTSSTDEKGTGPDGKYGTYDDGLPATYADFFTLCDKIASLGAIPVMWGGTVQEYASGLLSALAADYCGVEQTELNYNYSGTLEDPIVSFDSNGNPVFGDDIEITAQTGYNMYKQAGKYYALKFLEQLVSKTSRYNSSNATSGTFTHQDAEAMFVSGKYVKKITRVAMLIDGNWWQSEAKGTFNELAAEYGEEASMSSRQFGFMPLPKVDEDHLGDMTVLSMTGDIGFINAKCASYKQDLAKSFLQYCYTDESCREYTQITNVCRAVNFDIGDTYDSLTSWGKMIVDIHNTAVKAYQDSTSTIFRNYSTDLWYQPNLWLSKVNGQSYTYPTDAMIKYHITAEQYFTGLSDYWTPTVWAGKFKAV